LFDRKLILFLISNSLFIVIICFYYDTAIANMVLIREFSHGSVTVAISASRLSDINRFFFVTISKATEIQTKRANLNAFDVAKTTQINTCIRKQQCHQTFISRQNDLRSLKSPTGNNPVELTLMTAVEKYWAVAYW